MEETTTVPSPAVKPTHVPTMDVVAPHTPTTAETKPEPVAVKPAPPKETAGSKDEAVPAKEEKNKAKDKKPVAPKQPSNGVGMAIFATMVIVLGLAAMATYAYIKTQN